MLSKYTFEVKIIIVEKSYCILYDFRQYFFYWSDFEQQSYIDVTRQCDAFDYLTYMLDQNIRINHQL